MRSISEGSDVVDKKRRVLILAAGGGHTGSAVILAGKMRDSAELSFLVPKDDSLSIRRLEPFGHVRTLTKPRHPTTPAWRFFLRFIVALLEAFRAVPGDADAVVSLGQNFSIPPCLVAWVKGVPVVSLETRVRLTKPSRTAALLRHIARFTALQWDEQLDGLDGIVVGPIIPEKRFKPEKGGYLLVTAGTYGHEELFDAVSESGFERVVLQTGMVDGKRYSRKHPKWTVLDYTDDMEELIAGAETVVCPPGATPVEAAAYGKPVVIVGYPRWTKAADLEDTEIFADKIGAPLVLEITAENIEAAIDEAKEKERPDLVDGAEIFSEVILSI